MTFMDRMAEHARLAETRAVHLFSMLVVGSLFAPIFFGPLVVVVQELKSWEFVCVGMLALLWATPLVISLIHAVCTLWCIYTRPELKHLR